jgi:hypothetical protein
VFSARRLWEHRLDPALAAAFDDAAFSPRSLGNGCGSCADRGSNASASTTTAFVDVFPVTVDDADLSLC